jgi:bacterioferritin
MFLGGTPELSPTKTPKMAETLEGLFEADKTEEQGAIEFYSRAARDAAEANDIGTRSLFETIVMDEEGHWDWLDRQLATLKRMGEPSFMSIYMSGETAEG